MIAGFETPAATKTVSLVVNGKTIATRKVNVPADGRATVEFAPLDVPTDSIAARCGSKAATPFPRMTQRVRGQPVRSGAGVVCASGQRYAARRSISARRWPRQPGVLSLQSVDSGSRRTSIPPNSPSWCSPMRWRCLRSLNMRLRSTLRKGGSVLIALGTNAGHHARIPIWGGDVKDAHDYTRNGQPPRPSARWTSPIRRSRRNSPGVTTEDGPR